MLRDKTIFVAGGDLRQARLAERLSEDNRVYTLGLEKADGLEKAAAQPEALRGLTPDYLIFPIPVCSDPETVNTPFSSKRLDVEEVLSLAGPETLVLGGRLTEDFKARLSHRGLPFADLLEREEMAVRNAVPTAEGALQIAMEELPCTIFGMNILVTGYGRISRVLSRMLKALGARVKVSARRFSDLAWIEAEGCTPVRLRGLAEAVGDCRLIINTVPAPILGEEVLAKAPKDCLLIDLASKPGGVDIAAAGRLGLKAIWALSLPGKVAPLTAGDILFDTIQNIAGERGESLA